MMFLGLMGEIMKDRTMKRILEFILSLQCFVPVWKYLQPSTLGLNKGLEPRGLDLISRLED